MRVSNNSNACPVHINLLYGEPTCPDCNSKSEDTPYKSNDNLESTTDQLSNSYKVPPQDNKKPIEESKMGAAPTIIADTSLDDLRNLKYKGVIKSSIKAFVSLKKFDPISIEAVTLNIYKNILEIMEARNRSLLAQQQAKLLQVIEDEVIGRDILMENGTPVNHTLHNFRDRQRQALKKIKERL